MNLTPSKELYGTWYMQDYLRNYQEVRPYTFLLDAYNFHADRNDYFGFLTVVKDFLNIPGYFNIETYMNDLNNNWVAHGSILLPGTRGSAEIQYNKKSGEDKIEMIIDDSYRKALDFKGFSGIQPQYKPICILTNTKSSEISIYENCCFTTPEDFRFYLFPKGITQHTIDFTPDRKVKDWGFQNPPFTKDSDSIYKIIQPILQLYTQRTDLAAEYPLSPSSE